MRPLFYHYQEDPRSYTEQFEYLLGPDVLVAPVWKEDQTQWKVYLPSDGWMHLWTGAEYARGEHMVEAPLARRRYSAKRTVRMHRCLRLSVQSMGSKLWS